MRHVIVWITAGWLVLAATACTREEQPSAAAPSTGTATPAVATGVPGTTAPQVGTLAPAGAPANTVELVKRVRPSVVRINVRAGFGQAAGTGTGFVVDERGYIVTNNHVVTLGGGRVAPELKVDLADGRTVDARLVGRDERTDLAVLKVDAGRLTPLPFADPASIEVGEDVIAVGFALDLGGPPTVTKGVVSAIDRVIDETDVLGNPVQISGAIQTDAAINPGNSGGPLIDAEGRVVGINTAGIRGGFGTPVQGISFAVSSGVAQPIVKSLIETGTVRRGYLGVLVSLVDRTRAEALGLPVKEGVRIERVEPGSAAEQAGLRAGDVIVKVGTIDVKNLGDLTRALTQYGPGQKVTVEYYRGSDRRSTEVTLGERPQGSG
jgi:S1-C subfamily serine protease